MAIYKKSKGKWRVRVWMDGKRRDWVVKGTKAEAEDFEARKRVELARGVAQSGPRAVQTFSAFCESEYRPHAETRLKPSTWSKQTYLVATLVEHFGKLKLPAFDLAAVEGFARTRLRAGLKPVSVNNELRVLHRILAYAEELGHEVTIPRWKPLRERSSRAVQFWTEKEVGKLLAQCAIHAPDLQSILTCLANTGMRVGEAMALRWADVDLERNTMRVQYHEEEDWSPKTDKWRDVPINPVLRPFLTCPRISEKWVFPCASTKERWADWPQRKFNKVREKAGLAGGVHLLRHSYASHFLSKLPDLYLLSKVLGHSHTRTTSIYAHLLPDALDRVRGAVMMKPKAKEGPRVVKIRFDKVSKG
jgi:integrase